jgi:predicted N-acetyltransferase YhbS
MSIQASSVSSLDPAPQVVLAPERSEDRARVDGLIERAFGPGRLAKAAERLRERNAPLLDISRVAWDDGQVAGCVRMWPVHAGPAPAVLLGPFAVEDAWRGRGLGSRLIREACEAARLAGHGLVVLVGDAPFFGKLGFETAPPGRLVLPGPVDGRRVMWRALRPDALEGVEGPVRTG